MALGLHVLATLTYAQRLQAAGVPEAQASAQAEALRDVFQDQERTQATKADLAELRADFAESRADFEGLRGEVRTEIVELRTEVRTEMQALRTEVRTESQTLRTDFAQLEARLTKWMLAAAGVGGLLGGILGVASRRLKP